MRLTMPLFPLALLLLGSAALAQGVTGIPADGYTRAFLLDEGDGAEGNWLITPIYSLPGTAGALPFPDLTEGDAPEFQPAARAVEFRGLSESQQRWLLRDPASLPEGAFSVELWVNGHVSGEVGLVVSARGLTPQGSDGWALAYWSHGYASRTMSFRMGYPEAREEARYSNTEKDGFKEYWRHVVGVFDGQAMTLYVNGEPKSAQELGGPVTYPEDAGLALTGYFEHEPWMELSSLVRRVRLHGKALTPEDIQARFAALCDEVERGVVYPGHFHLNAGPYLSHVSPTSASVVWESGRPSASTIAWGTTGELGESHELAGPATIHAFTIEELEADTPYFYRITVRGEDGEELDTGLLSFRTAALPGQPIRFGVIGDTETRPHVNQQLSRLLWDERLSFAVNLGDLTDGGYRPNKFQWNYEYFQGVIPLASRMPIFTVPGNGEGDLYWYKAYHKLPGEESPYMFQYGDAAFFMLDSNRKGEFRPGKRQHAWLEEGLAASEAKWKFVCFHHAPYTSEENDYGDAWREESNLGDGGVRPLTPLFERYGVDVVMFGHLHLYERTRPMINGKVNAKGVLYLLCGGGGGNLEDFSPNPSPFTTRTHRGHHYCVIDLFGDELNLRMHDLNGAMRDQFTLRKP